MTEEQKSYLLYLLDEQMEDVRLALNIWNTQTVINEWQYNQLKIKEAERNLINEIRKELT